MHLELHRVEMDKDVPPGRENRRTRGSLFVDGRLECHILEDEVRDLKADGSGKVKGHTAIPAGTYGVIKAWSGKHQCWVPMLVGVPFFSAIEIHSGHDERDTEGCLLTAGGFDAAGDVIAGTSRPARDQLYPKIFLAIEAGQKVDITITNDFQQVA